jgi:butyrate kinase
MERNTGDLRGLRNIRSMRSSGKNSIPKNQSSAYLDFYMLNIEKKRLLKEDENLSIRKDTIRKRLEEIKLQMDSLQEVKDIAGATRNVGSSGGTFTQKDELKKDWKKMPLNY